MAKQSSTTTVSTVGLLGLACVLAACGDDTMPRAPTKDRKEAVNSLAIDASGDGGIELKTSVAAKALYFGAKVTAKKGEVLPLELTTTDGEFRLPATTYLAAPLVGTNPAALAEGGAFLPSTAREAGVLTCASPAIPTAATIADAQALPFAPCAAPVAQATPTTALSGQPAGMPSEEITGVYLTTAAPAVQGVYVDQEPGRAPLVVCREQASLRDGRGKTHRIDSVYIAAAADCRAEYVVEVLGFTAAASDANATAQLLLCLSPSGLETAGRFHYNILAPLGAGGAFCGEAGDEAVFLGLLPDLRLAAAEAARQQKDFSSEVAASYRHATDEEPTAQFVSDWAARLTAANFQKDGAARLELTSTLGSLRRERLGHALEGERIRLYGLRSSEDTNAAAALAGWVESYSRNQLALSTAVAAYRDAVLAQPAYADSIQELAKLRKSDESCGVDALALMKAGASRADVLARLGDAPSTTEISNAIRKHLDRDSTTDERNAWSAWSRCHLATKSGVEAAVRVTASSK